MTTRNMIETWIAPTFTVQYGYVYWTDRTRRVIFWKHDDLPRRKSTDLLGDSWVLLDASLKPFDGLVHGVTKMTSASSPRGPRQYETDAEHMMSIAIAAEQRPSERSTDYVPRLWKKDPVQDNLDHFVRKNPAVLLLDGMTTRERWDNIDAFQTWRYPELYGSMQPVQLVPRIRVRRGTKVVWQRVKSQRVWTRGTKRVWKSDVYTAQTLSKSIVSNTRPTGQIILVPPTPRTIPYEDVSRVGSILGNVTPGVGLDEALNATFTTTSRDKNFVRERGESAEVNGDGDDIVSGVVTPMSLGYVHSPTGKFRDFKTLPSATMHGSVEGSEEPECDRDGLLHLGVRDFTSAFERALMFEVHHAWTTASKADNNMSDSKLAAWMRRYWKSRKWEASKVRPEYIYGVRWLGFEPPQPMFNNAVTEYLRHITYSQVLRQREKSQQRLKDYAAQRAGIAYDVALASLAETLSNLAQTST